MRCSASTRRHQCWCLPLLEVLENRNLLSFLPPVHYPTGLNPNIPGFGDFNRDGALDLAVDNAEGHNVSVFLGNGDGTFQPHQTYATGRRPYSLAVVDVNVDKFLDLVTSNFGSGDVSVLLGNGDGTFKDAIHSPAGPRAEDAKAGDFNADGWPDLAVPLNRNPAAVLVLLGNGDGTFGAPTSYPLSGAAAFLAITDVNGDAHLDLAVPIHAGAEVGVLLGNGDGTFQEARNYAAGPRPVMVAAGDFNADGASDLAASNDADPGTVHVLLNAGDGTFRPPVPYPVGAVAPSVAVGDVNLDGVADLIVASLGAGVTVYLGAGDGTFGARMDFVVQNTPAADVADLNADGFPDLIVANYGSNTLSVLLNDGYWGGPAVSFAVSPDSGTVAAGAAFDLHVFALSDTFEIVTNYMEEVIVYSTDPRATLPDVYRFQLTDRGVASFPGGVTFRTPGVQELYVFDTATYTVIGYAVFTVVGAGPGSGPAFDWFVGQELARRFGPAEVAASFQDFACSRGGAERY